MEMSIGNFECNYYAVRFTVTDPPGTPCELVKARFCLFLDWAATPPTPFEVIVFHADGVTEYTRFNVTGPTVGGWYEVEFNPPIIIYQHDFYMAAHWIQDSSQLTLGEDRDGPHSGGDRSYLGPPMTLFIDGGTAQPEDWMIRAVVTEYHEPVGGEIISVNSLALLAPWIVIAIVALTISTIALSKRKLFLH
jgi:hypothetical protein